MGGFSVVDCVGWRGAECIRVDHTRLLPGGDKPRFFSVMEAAGPALAVDVAKMRHGSGAFFRLFTDTSSQFGSALQELLSPGVSIAVSRGRKMARGPEQEPKMQKKRDDAAIISAAKGLFTGTVASAAITLPVTFVDRMATSYQHGGKLGPVNAAMLGRTIRTAVVPETMLPVFRLYALTYGASNILKLTLGLDPLTAGLVLGGLNSWFSITRKEMAMAAETAVEQVYQAASNGSRNNIAVSLQNYYGKEPSVEQMDRLVDVAKAKSEQASRAGVRGLLSKMGFELKLPMKSIGSFVFRDVVTMVSGFGLDGLGTVIRSGTLFVLQVPLTLSHQFGSSAIHRSRSMADHFAIMRERFLPTFGFRCGRTTFLYVGGPLVLAALNKAVGLVKKNDPTKSEDPDGPCDF